MYGRSLVSHAIVACYFFIVMGCSDECDKTTNPSSSQQTVGATITFYESYRYYGETLDSICWLWGNVAAKSLPVFQYYDAVFPMDSIRCSDHDFMEYGPGYIRFESIDLLHSLQSSDWFRLHVMTSLGKVSGHIPRPPKVQNIEFSVNDSIDKGESFSVTWDDDGAGFYYLFASYSWLDVKDQYHYDYLDTFVTSNRVDFEGARFSKDGVIVISAVGSASGAFPVAGAKANMSGQGTGFLYYVYPEIMFEEIVVGNGIVWSAKPSGLLPEEQTKRILNLLNFAE